MLYQEVRRVGRKGGCPQETVYILPGMNFSDGVAGIRGEGDFRVVWKVRETLCTLDATFWPLA